MAHLRRYPPCTLIVCCQTLLGGKPDLDRFREGDLVGIHDPNQDGLGVKEAKHYMLLPLASSLLDTELSALFRPAPPLKRRYCIPFKRLAELTDFDESRARDPEDVYQPFVGVETIRAPGLGWRHKHGGTVVTAVLTQSAYLFLGIRQRPFLPWGLIFDQVAGRYITDHVL